MVIRSLPVSTAMFPSGRANPDGTRRVSHSGYQHALGEWLLRCDVRDERGRPVHMTPHQWRHTLGTRLKRRGVAPDATFRNLHEDGAVRDAGASAPMAIRGA